MIAGVQRKDMVACVQIDYAYHDQMHKIGHVRNPSALGGSNSKAMVAHKIAKKPVFNIETWKIVSGPFARTNRPSIPHGRKSLEERRVCRAGWSTKDCETACVNNDYAVARQLVVEAMYTRSNVSQP